MTIDQITNELIDTADVSTMCDIRTVIDRWCDEQLKKPQPTDVGGQKAMSIYSRAKHGERVREAIAALENECARTGRLEYLEMADELDGGVPWQ